MIHDRSTPQPEVNEVSSDSTPAAGKVKFQLLWLTLPWALGLYLIGQYISVLPGWAVFLAVFVFGVPVALFSLYLVTVGKIHGLAGFSANGWLYRLFGSRWLLNLIWSVVSVITTFFLLLQFRHYAAAEWLALVSLVPIFYLVFWLLYLATRRELKPYRQIAVALRIARRITPVIGVGFYLWLMQMAGGVTQVGSLAEAIELRKAESPVVGGSALVHEVSQWMAYFDGARLYLAGQVGQEHTWFALLIVALGAWALFFNVTSALACFLVPRAEYRRVFTPLSDADDPPRVGFIGSVFVSALITLVLIFVLVPMLKIAELHLQKQPAFAEVRRQLDRAVVRIDGHLYSPEVVKAISGLKFDATRELGDIRPRLLASLDAGFDRVEGNVEPFLDWYYQLSAEYLRALNLLSGDLESYVGDKLREYLQHGNPFGEYEMLLSQAIAQHEAVKTRFKAESTALLDQHRMTLPEGSRYTVTQTLSFNNVFALPSPVETIPFGARVGAGGASGAVTSAVVGKVMAKMYAKGVLKLAAQPLAKLFFSRAAIVGGSMAGGAAIGSVVPGPGTAVGAAIGIGVGLVAGVFVDYGLLKLEEHLGRDTFREQLLEAIRDTRREMVDS